MYTLPHYLTGNLKKHKNNSEIGGKMEIFKMSGRTGKIVSTAAQVRQASNLWLSSPSPNPQPAHRWEGPCTWARPSEQSLVFLVMTQFSLSFWSFLVNLKLFWNTVHWRYNKAIVGSKSGCICCLFFHQGQGWCLIFKHVQKGSSPEA